MPLFVWLLVVGGLQHGWRFLRQLLPHAAGAVLLLYVLVGVYILANGAVTGYRGLTESQNINLLGKVMQYHMQLEAPPQYAKQAQIVNSFVAAGKVRSLDPLGHTACVYRQPFRAGEDAPRVVLERCLREKQWSENWEELVAGEGVEPSTNGL